MNNCCFYQVTKMPSKGDFELFILVNCMDSFFPLAENNVLVH